MKEFIVESINYIDWELGIEFETTLINLSFILMYRSISQLFYWGYNVQFQILIRRELEKNDCLGGLKEFLPWMFTWGALIKYGPEVYVQKFILACFSQTNHWVVVC